MRLASALRFSFANYKVDHRETTAELGRQQSPFDYLPYPSVRHCRSKARNRCTAVVSSAGAKLPATSGSALYFTGAGRTDHSDRETVRHVFGLGDHAGGAAERPTLVTRT